MPASPALIVDVFTKTGIALCPEFTAKAMRGMLEEMRTNPGRFAGKRVLFLLTGTNKLTSQRFSGCMSLQCRPVGFPIGEEGMIEVALRGVSMCVCSYADYEYTCVINSTSLPAMY